MSLPIDPDDGWADLARELGVEQTVRTSNASIDHHDRAEQTSEALSATPVVHHDDQDDFDSTSNDPGSEGEFGRDTDSFEDDGPEGSEADESDSDADGEGDAEGEASEGDEGSPKKRRRRRRRRKKRTAEDATIDPASSTESAGETDPEPMNDDGFQEPFIAANQTEPSREWSNWDVPSWVEIVAGLYRPGR